MTELATRQEEDIVSSPLQILSRAMRDGADIAAVTQLSALCERWKDTLAREAFGRALATFQMRCPPIVKRNTVPNKDGSLRYKFASYEDVWALAGPLLAELGISVSFSAPQTSDGMYCCVCVLRVNGYQEERPFSAPMPNLAAIAGQMHIAEPAAFGVVLSYYKRYALCAALNIVVVGEDSDLFIGHIQQTGVTEEQATELRAILAKRGGNEKRLCSWAAAREKRPINSIEEMSLNSWEFARDEALKWLAARDRDAANAEGQAQQAKAGKGAK